MAKKREKDSIRLKYYKTSPKHWPDIRDKIPNSTTRNNPLWKIFNKIPIRAAEFRRIINHYKSRGLSFSFPVNKIKFIDEDI